MIETMGLGKVYGSTLALSDLTLEVRKGEVVGLLGPNGAGKTTTIRLLLGFLHPSARADVLELVSEARRSGQTVIFSGHVLSEVEQVADRVAIMRRGRLMHIEDMHERRSLRMLLVKYAGAPPASYPAELELTLKS